MACRVRKRPGRPPTGSGSSAPNRPVRAQPVVPAVSRDAEPATEPDWLSPSPPDDDRSAGDVGSGDVERGGDGFGQPQVRLTGEPADPDSSVTAVRPVNPGQTAVPSSGAAPDRTAPLDRTPHRRGSRGVVPRHRVTRAPDRGSGHRRGVKRTPTGWLTRRNSLRPCSGTTRWPSARWTRPTVPMWTGAPGSSTSRGCGPERPVRSARPHIVPTTMTPDLHTIAPITEPTEVVPSGVRGRRSAGPVGGDSAAGLVLPGLTLSVVRLRDGRPGTGLDRQRPSGPALHRRRPGRSGPGCGGTPSRRPRRPR